MKMEEGEKLQNHLVKFENLVSKIQSNQPDQDGVPVEMNDEDKICYLFMTLPDLFDSYIDSLEGASEHGKLSYDYVKQKLLGYEEKKTAEKDQNVEKEDSAAF